MVGSQTLFDVHRRLKEIMGHSEFDETIFGGVSVLAVGDLYQLQPVKQKHIFDLPSDINVQLCGCLWENFVMMELKTIMRQKEDQTFAELLNRIRTGSQTSEDIALLQTRIINRNDPNYPSDTLHVFTTNRLTDEHNEVMLSTLPPPYFTVMAIDSKKDIQTGQVVVKPPQKSSETGGLKEKLTLAKGCRVMLTANLNVSDGLVNGATGTVEDIELQNDNVRCVIVRFDRDDVGQQASAAAGRYRQVPIGRHEAKITVGRHYGAEMTRSQFPLTLAWGCTIHKVQGITVDRIVVCMSGRFNPGQAYVALSRVRSISGLYLTDFSASKITASDKAREAMTTLRQKSAASVSVDDSDVEMTVHMSSSGSSGTEPAAVVARQAAWPRPMWSHHLVEDKRLLSICEKFQLTRRPRIEEPEEHENKALTHHVEKLIADKCSQNTIVTVHRTDGDGNCLFRALSLGLTQSQDAHNLIRNYVINHLLDTTQPEDIEHIANMGRDGVWGTDKEICAAAELFNCRIICCSRYGNSNQLCLQYFSPHGLDGSPCTSVCQHPTIVLLNSSGVHYEYAGVRLKATEE